METRTFRWRRCALAVWAAGWLAKCIVQNNSFGLADHLVQLLHQKRRCYARKPWPNRAQSLTWTSGANFQFDQESYTMIGAWKARLCSDWPV